MGAGGIGGGGCLVLMLHLQHTVLNALCDICAVTYCVAKIKK